MGGSGPHFPKAMSRKQKIGILVVGLWVLGVVGFLMSSASSDPDVKQVRARYAQMRAALSAKDAEAVKLLMAPSSRAGAGEEMIRRLDQFAKTLVPSSSVSISGSQARICPKPVYHFGILPGGDTVEMIKVDGEWFFTGKVHID